MIAKKKHLLLFTALCLGTAAPVAVQAQDDFKLETETLTDAENTPAPVFPVPSDRQLKWNETEFYAFFHYGMNTYTGREWGNGDEDRSLFAPTKKPNPKQWLETAKKAGMKGGIAVIKHHNGFCLWPTNTTEHCVKNAGNEFGKQTNIPKDFAEAAKELKLKYGFYISPWDRNSRYWGKKDENGNYTDDYTKNVFFPQCAEAAGYGHDQFEMWFDGATGGGGYYGGESDKNRTIGNAEVHSTERLFQMYLETVGRNATLILNLPPDKSGYLPDQTVKRMEEFGKELEKRLSTDLAKTAKITASATRANGAKTTYVADNLKDDNKDTYWATDDNVKTATLTFEWDTPQTIRYVSMMEYIRLGQRIKGFSIETSEDGQNFVKRGGNIATTTVGYKRIIPLNGSTQNSYNTGYKAKIVRITITDSKACPLLHTVSIY